MTRAIGSISMQLMEPDRHVGPEAFRRFDNVPNVFAIALAEGGSYIWYNDSFAEHLKQIRGTGKLESIRDYLDEQQLEERMRQIQPVLEDGKPTTYFQLVDGTRYRTRVWALDEHEFGRHGWFKLFTPDLRRASDADVHLTLTTGMLGELSQLSSRELVVLRLTAEGLSASECAKVEFRSVKTIENQVQAIHNKLGLANRAELVRGACERGLIAFTREEWARIVQTSQRPTRAKWSTLEEIKKQGAHPTPRPDGEY